MDWKTCIKTMDAEKQVPVIEERMKEKMKEYEDTLRTEILSKNGTCDGSVCENDGSNKLKLFQVAQQVEDLGKNLEQLGIMVDQIEKRLSSVLAFPPPQGEQKKTPKEPALVPLAEVLRKFNKMCTKAHSKLNYIRSRIEL